MAKIIIDENKCKGCFLCISFCPKGLIKKSAKLNRKGVNFAFFIGSGCAGCKQCAIICPESCIEVYKDAE